MQTELIRSMGTAQNMSHANLQVSRGSPEEPWRRKAKRVLHPESKRLVSPSHVKKLGHKMSRILQISDGNH